MNEETFEDFEPKTKRERILKSLAKRKLDTVEQMVVAYIKDKSEELSEKGLSECQITKEIEKKVEGRFPQHKRLVPMVRVENPYTHQKEIISPTVSKSQTGRRFAGWLVGLLFLLSAIFFYNSALNLRGTSINTTGDGYNKSTTKIEKQMNSSTIKTKKD